MSGEEFDFSHYYNTGMSWEEFLEKSPENVERMRSFYDDFDADEDDLTFFNSRTPLQVLCIAESWCPDVVQNVAMMARIADEVPGMELSIVGREDNPELMNQFETDGRRRIPVFAFYDMTFRELGRWAGRCKPADEWIFGEVVAEKKFDEFSDEEVKAFNDEYDKRFRDTYARNSLAEWEHLLTEEDF